MKHKILKSFLLAVILILAILFLVKFAGPSFLKFYLEAGLGDCQKIPIFCKMPQGEINLQIDKEYLTQLSPRRFAKMEVWVPDGFSVVQQRIKKEYYKKWKRFDNDSVIYVLYEEPYFFVNLFPQLKKSGVGDDYEFIRRVMFARLGDVKSITDTFFMIMKGIFIPDLGDQNQVKMAFFTVGDKRGFLNYNLNQPQNYFDCNVIDERGAFFKVYIKDKTAKLDINKVMTIISTLKALEVN